MYKKVFSDVQCCKNRRRLYFRVKIRRHIGCTTLFWDWDLVLRNLHGVGGGEHLSSCQSSHVLERESKQDGGHEWRKQKACSVFLVYCRMIEAFVVIRRDVPRLLNLPADSSKTFVHQMAPVVFTEAWNAYRSQLWTKKYEIHALISPNLLINKDKYSRNNQSEIRCKPKDKMSGACHFPSDKKRYLPDIVRCPAVISNTAGTGTMNTKMLPYLVALGYSDTPKTWSFHPKIVHPIVHA